MAIRFRENFEFTRGDDWTIVWEMTTDGVTPLNVSARTYAMQIRLSSEATSSTAWTCTVGGTSSNEVTCFLPNTTTRNLSTTTYKYDLQETTAGIITTLGGGEIKCNPDVTR